MVKIKKEECKMTALKHSGFELEIFRMFSPGFSDGRFSRCIIL